MRLNLATASAVAIAAAMFHQPVNAAEVSEQGAKELQSALDQVLPEKLVEKSIIAVTAKNDAYEFLFDLPKLIGLYDTPQFSLKHITPMTLLMAPADGDRWKVEGTNDFAMSGTGKDEEGKPSSFSYTMSKVTYSGIAGPALDYIFSSDLSSGEGVLKATVGDEKTDLSFSGMNYVVSSVAGAGKDSVDIRGTAEINDFKQSISTSQSPLEFAVESITANVGASGVKAEKLRDLYIFIAEKAGKDKLDAAEIEAMKGHVRGALPFFTSIDETFELRNLKVNNGTESVLADAGSYMLKISGPLEATELSFGFGAKGLSLPDGAVPPMYAPFVPTVTDVQLSAPNLNLQAPIDVMLNADYSKEKPISDAEAAAMGLSVFPGGAYTVNINKSVVTAPSYDLEISGKVTGSLMAPDRVAVDAVILARDFDKTMDAVQELGKADPEAMQAFLGMSMVKGLAKTDADGRSRWEVSVDQNRKVTINGNLLPF